MRDVKKVHLNVRDVYGYLLKLILFITIIFSGTSFVGSLVDFLIPNDYIESFESYVNNYTFESSEGYTEEQMKSLYNDYVESEKSIQSNYKLNSLLTNFIILTLCLSGLWFLRKKYTFSDTNCSIITNNDEVTNIKK